jgi:sugar phosphate isomerase/epimerase
MIDLSLAHLSELEVPPLELAALAARAGLATIGLRTMAASPGGIEYPLRSATEQAAMRRRVADTGVTVLYIELISLSETTDLAACAAMLAAGAAIGAQRVVAAGDSRDVAVVADRMARVCELARPYAIAVDLEFMPFRGVRSFADAHAVVTRAAQPNGHILIDALHVFRSTSDLAAIRAADRALLGTFQICDAPAQPPPDAELVVEARTRRLMPGHGGLDLHALIDALPADIPYGLEVPLAGQYPDLPPGDRLALQVRETRKFLEQRSA